MTQPDPVFQRAALLYDQGNYAQAERYAREHLASAPDDAVAHALLALALIEQDKPRPAGDAADRAIALDPGDAFCHYVRSRVLTARNDPNGGVAAARETIRLAPRSVRGYAALASAHAAAGRWREVLAATGDGLAIDPESDVLLTLRGLAETNLGRGAEARATFEGALRLDPSNSYAHASRGLAHLHDGRMDQALASFEEALRLDPNNPMARSGLVEALKARNPLYAALLRFMLWITRLGSRNATLLFIGFFVAQRVLRGVADSNPSLAPFITPILVAYLIVVWLTFAAQPLFDLLLRLDPVGRHALSTDQRRASNLIGPLVVIGFIGAILTVATGIATVPAIIATLGLGLVIPIAAAYDCDAGWPRWVFFGIAAAVLALGLLGILLAATGQERLGFGLGILCIVIISLSTWLTIPLTRVRVTR